jgi:hypothetical protein
MVVTLKTYSKTIMKTNFKKLTRDEQLMVNGGAFGQKLICRYYPSQTPTQQVPIPPSPGQCITFNIPNGNPCQYGGGPTPNYVAGAIICDSKLGGGANDYYVGNEFTACFC